MRCVKCNRELEEGSRFCEHCGAPQPLSPMSDRVFCPNCGKEIPAGSRFCASCGTPVQGMGGGARQGLPLPGPQKPKKDNGKTVLIVGIAAVAVLIFALIIAIVLLIGSRKKDSWEAEERESRYEEEERDREEEKEEAPEEEEVPEEVPEEEPEEEPAAEEPEEEPAEPEHTGNYAEVDFNKISYRPADQPYDVLTDEDITALNGEINVVTVPGVVINGTIYSSSENEECDVAVYGDLRGTDPVQVMLLEEREDGSVNIWIYIYKDQEFAECTYLKEDEYENTLEHIIYLYSDDCMVFYGDAVNSEALYRMDLGTQSSTVKSQFMEDEAEYYNRGRLIYDIVSEWE